MMKRQLTTAKRRHGQNRGAEEGAARCAEEDTGRMSGGARAKKRNTVCQGFAFAAFRNL